MAYDDVVLATGPLRYWPLTETSGTNANELVANEDATAVNMVMGGADGPEGLGGKAPKFEAAGDHILLRANKLLGGEAQWSIAAWIYLDPSNTTTAIQTVYGENNGLTPGVPANWVRAGAYGGASSSIQVYYGDDASATQFNAPSIYHLGFWVYCVWTRDAGTIEMWYNAGRRSVTSGQPAGSTWTEAGVKAWLGNTPRNDSQWIGAIRNVAVYDKVLTGAEQLTMYESATPEQRPLIDRAFWRPNAIWNQKISDFAEPPPLAADNDTIVTNLASAAGYFGTGANASTGPVWVSNNTDPLVRVRILDGEQNISAGHPDLYNAMGQVRMPVDFVNNPHSDAEAQIYNEDTDELWEFYVMYKTLTGTSLFTTVEGSAGAHLPAGYVWHFVAGAKADGSTGYVGYRRLNVNGSQGVRLTWNPIEGADHYVIYRQNNGSGSSPVFQIGTVANTVFTFLDNGTVPNGAVYPGLTAVTSDWGCSYAGYIDGTDDSVGHYEGDHWNWGPAASGMPLFGGSITIREMQAGVIPHAIAMAMPNTYPWAHVYPAQRNDGSDIATGIMEGTRFWLDPAFDVDSLPGAFERMVAKALQDYGGYHRDTSVLVGVYIEDETATGRDYYPSIFEGRLQFEILRPVEDQFPWDRMRVIDPEWTRAVANGEILPGAASEPKWDTITDTFNALDAPRWDVATGSASATGGQLHLVSGPTSQVDSTFTADILDSEIIVDIASTGAAYAEGDAGIYLQSPTSLLRIGMGVYSDALPPIKLYMDYVSDPGVHTRLPVTPTWNATTTRYWRIREVAGTIEWATSSNGLAWTTHNSVLRSSLGWPEEEYEELGLSFVTNAYGVSPPVLPDFIVSGLNVAVPPPPPPKWETITDSFTTFDTVSTWDVVEGSAAAVAGRLNLTSTPRSYVESQFVGDLLGSEIVVDVASPGAASAEGDAEIWLSSGVLRIRMGVFADVPPIIMFMDVRDSTGTTTRLLNTPTWNATDTRYWRIREIAGTIEFATSANGSAWTTHNSVLRSTLGFSDPVYQGIKLAFSTNYWGAQAVPPVEFVIDGLNTIGQVGLTSQINLPTSMLVQSRDTELVLDGD